LASRRLPEVDPIPASVRRFVEERIESVGLLDVLMLLHSRPHRAWTAAELSREVRSERHWAEVHLEYLRSQALLTAEPGPNGRAYRYGPPSGELDDVVGQLSEAFRKHPVSVIRLIFRQPSPERLGALEASRLRQQR
jgi:hypothetical protein